MSFVVRYELLFTSHAIHTRGISIGDPSQVFLERLPVLRKAFAFILPGVLVFPFSLTMTTA